MVRAITTSITINASKEKIWKILTNTDEYSEWNPFIRKLDGDLSLDNTIVVELQNGDSTMKFKPKIIHLEENQKFTWKGKLFLPKLFDGKHSFELEELDNGNTRFIHSEEFSGILVWLILKFIGEETKENFKKMNEALKTRVESIS